MNLHEKIYNMYGNISQAARQNCFVRPTLDQSLDSMRRGAFRFDETAMKMWKKILKLSTKGTRKLIQEYMDEHKVKTDVSKELGINLPN